MDLATAKAVITGGASGLGFATAQRVVAAGGQVALLDINEEQGESSAADLGAGASFIKVDVADEASVKAAISRANERMGGITLAVNCAGIATAGRALGREGPWPTELFNKVIQVNLVGTFSITKEAAAFMAQNEPNDEGERGVIGSERAGEQSASRGLRRRAERHVDASSRRRRRLRLAIGAARGGRGALVAIKAWPSQRAQAEGDRAQQRHEPHRARRRQPGPDDGRAHRRPDRDLAA